MTSERPPGSLVNRRQNADTPVTFDGPIVARLDLSDLCVAVHTIEQTTDTDPQPEPLGEVETAVEAPAGLDPAWTMCRYGPGYCALEVGGKVACFWPAVSLGPDQTLAVEWDSAWRSVPCLEAAQIDERVGTWIEAGEPLPNVLVIPRKSSVRVDAVADLDASRHHLDYSWLPPC